MVHPLPSGAKDRVEPRSARLYAGRLRVKVLLAKGSTPPRRFALLLDPPTDQQKLALKGSCGKAVSLLLEGNALEQDNGGAYGVTSSSFRLGRA